MPSDLPISAGAKMSATAATPSTTVVPSMIARDDALWGLIAEVMVVNTIAARAAQ